jgi:hypothetical protein
MGVADRKIGCLLDLAAGRQPTQGNGWIGKQCLSGTPGKKEGKKGGAFLRGFFQELSSFSSHLYIRPVGEKSCSVGMDAGIGFDRIIRNNEWGAKRRARFQAN